MPNTILIGLMPRWDIPGQHLAPMPYENTPRPPPPPEAGWIGPENLPWGDPWNPLTPRELKPRQARRPLDLGLLTGKMPWRRHRMPPWMRRAPPPTFGGPPSSLFAPVPGAPKREPNPSGIPPTGEFSPDWPNRQRWKEKPSLQEVNLHPGLRTT